MDRTTRTGICIALASLVILTSYYFNSRSKSLIIIGAKLGNVTKIIDASTIEINSTRTMSLNGIITPYKDEKFYQNAYDYLNQTLLNREVDVLISKTGWDSKYPLVYIFVDGKNINAAMVEQGLAQTFYPAYQPGNDLYYYDMKDAQIKCIKNKQNLCDISKFSHCLMIDQLMIERRKKVVIKNQCKEEINLKNWAFKGNGRIQKEIRENMVLGIGEEAIVEMNNYIFETVNEQFKKQITIIDSNKQLVFYHDFY